jgi:hypothetical protein
MFDAAFYKKIRPQETARPNFYKGAIMIGLSVSKCIYLIASGKAKIEDVTKIIGSTHCAKPEDWEKLILHYKKEFWGKRADEAERILRLLLAEGKIEQPRLADDSRYPLSSGTNVWIREEDEEDIQWHQPSVAA